MPVYKYLFFSVLLVLCACNNENRVPDNVISMARMPAIVAEVHIADGDISNLPQAPDSLYKLGKGEYVAIFKKYHTNTAQFKKSFEWYTRHPLLLDSIANQVITILQFKNDSLTKIKVPAPKTKNSTVPPVTPANAVPVQ